MQNGKDSATYQAVQYDKFGGIDVLYITDLPKRSPEPGQVLIKMKATGINPGETSIREGKMAKQFPSTFPSGQGSDFAGIVEAVGENVSNFKAEDEVIGFSNDRKSHAEYLIVNAYQLIIRPPKISWEQAGGLYVAGNTAYACIEAVSLKAGETVIVANAAGGVGSIVVQLAKNLGANIIGLAGKENHEWLQKQGVTPLDYKDDLQQKIEDALHGEKADAFIDTFGKGYVELAIKLGIPTDHINTISDFEAAKKYNIKAEGLAKASTIVVLSKMAAMVNDGKLEITVAKTYPLTQVQEAYKDLEQRHTHGKIVLIA